MTSPRTARSGLLGIVVAVWVVASPVDAEEPAPAATDPAPAPSPDPDPKDPPPSRDGPIRKLGDWGQLANPAIAALIAISEDDSEGLRDLARGCLITVVGTSVLKQVFNFTPLGKRPSGGDDSFPSGHASAAMCAPAFVHERYRETRYTAPLTATGGFVAYSRVWARKHRWRDVLASTALALVVAHNTTERHEDDDDEPLGGASARLTGLSSASAVPSGVQLGLVESVGFRQSDPRTPTRITGMLELGSWSGPDLSSQRYWGVRIQGSF